MKTPGKVGIGLLALGVVGTGIFLSCRRGDGHDGPKTVTVERGTIVEKALAVGQIVPEQEIQVKSQISGIVKDCYVEVGDRVQPGDRLFSISPDPTPLELTQAERELQIADVGLVKAKADWQRSQSLEQSGILARNDFDGAQKSYDQARIERDLAHEKLALLKEGRIQKKVGGIDSVIRASAAGTVLERLVNPGDPVVPLTTYQAGTALMTLADMGKLIFRGTVDEIDVGKLKEGLPVRIQIGALPSAQVTGRLRRIAPKAKEKDGATQFDVEVEILEAKDIVLRAGFSANATIVIREKKDALLLPERLVTFEGDKAFVETPAARKGDKPVRKEIKVGLSDGLNLEVVSGLAEKDVVVEPPPKEIKGL
ncbi:MAG: efflux RND transporter periplasmic adaptor subunit [Acidobacteriota bacterium]